jgi:hypothetical protein
LAARVVFEVVFGFFVVFLAFSVAALDVAVALDVVVFFGVFFAAACGLLVFFEAVFTPDVFFVVLTGFDLAPTFFAGLLALSLFLADLIAIKSCPPEKSNIQSRLIGEYHYLN